MSDTEEVRIVAELYYKEPIAALEWLSDVFGLSTRIVVHDAQDNFVFAEAGWLGGEHSGSVARTTRAKS